MGAENGRRSREPGRPRDPYEVLGIAPTASKKEITDAFRMLAQRYHPDRHVTSSAWQRAEAQRRMAELNEAYREARRRRPPAAYSGTTKIESACVWLGTAPGTWARYARRTGAQMEATEEDRRQRQERIAQATAEYQAQSRVLRDIREQVEQSAGKGYAVARPKPRSNGVAPKAMAGLGQALHTNELRCLSCRSLQVLPAGWQQRMGDTNFHCSRCAAIILAR